MIETSRCVREYTDKAITAKYGNLTQSRVNELRQFPCIFAYESKCQKDPLFGVIREVISRQGDSRIDYQIINVNPFNNEQAK